MKHLFSSLILLAAATLQAAVVLTDGGQTKCEIIVGRNAHPAIAHAASELADYTGRLGKSAPPAVCETPSAGAFHRIVYAVVGSDAWAAAVASHPEFAADAQAIGKTDGYAVRTRGKDTYLLADCPSGLLNATYRWLFRNTDILWPRPAGGVAVYSTVPRLVFEQDDYLDVPKFRLRLFGGQNNVKNHDVLDYLVRNGSNVLISLAQFNDESRKAWGRSRGIYEGYFDIFGGGHNMERFWLPRERYLKEHPDYYMQKDGKPVVQKFMNFCETNPAVVDAFCRRLDEVVPTLPKSCRMMSVLMEDTRRTCECPECLKPITLEDGTVVAPDDPAFKSTRFFIFFNKIARHAKKLKPDLMLRQFAYFHLAVPPKVKVESNIEISFCPYPRNMKQSVTEGGANAEWRRRLDGWLANTTNLYYREYYFCGCIYYPRPIADTAAVDLRYLLGKGVRDVYTDSAGTLDTPSVINQSYALYQPYSEHWDVCAPEDWTVIQLFWDPTQDPQALREEFLKRLYREAAPQMTELYRSIRDTWNGDPMPASFNDNGFASAAQYIVRKNLAETYRNLLEQAEKAAVHPESIKAVKAVRAVFEKHVASAQVFSPTVMSVPKLATPAELPFDLKAEPWKSGRKLARFLKLTPSPDPNTPDRDPKEGTPRTGIAKLYYDDQAIHVALRLFKDPSTLAAGRQDAPGAYPRGERFELAFAVGTVYYHFVSNRECQKYEAKGQDRSWSRPWDVKTQATRDGWAALVAIPWTSLELKGAPEKRMPCMVMLSFAPQAGEAKNYNVSWRNGLSHAPASWSMLKFVK